jgi:hypothetical protein
MNNYKTHTEVDCTGIRTDTRTLAGGTQVHLTLGQIYSRIEITQPRGEFKIKPLRLTILPSAKKVRMIQERHDLYEALYALKEAGLKIAQPCPEYDAFSI